MKTHKTRQSIRTKLMAPFNRRKGTKKTRKHLHTHSGELTLKWCSVTFMNFVLTPVEMLQSVKPNTADFFKKINKKKK